MYFYSILCACNTITVVYYSSIAHGAMVDGKFSINRGAVGNEIIVLAKIMLESHKTLLEVRNNFALPHCSAWEDNSIFL